MDLQSVRGVDADLFRALQGSGILTVADLARVTDVDGTGAALGVTPEAVAALQAAAQARIVEALHAAGVGSEAALAEADPEAVARATGIARGDVAWFQDAAREALGVGQRVVLLEGNRSARVELPGMSLERVAVATAVPGEDVRSLLETIPGDLVLLRAGEPTAMVRIGGVEREGVPIYRPRADGGMARVRVVGVREKRVVERGPSLLRRWLSR